MFRGSIMMNIININNLQKNTNNKIIYVEEDNIYLSKFESDKYYISKINLQNSHETIITSWKCNKSSFNNTKTITHKNTFLSIVQEDCELVIRKTIRDKVGLIFEKRYNISGNIFIPNTVLFVDENNIIIFLMEKETSSYDSFLCDLLEDKNYHINDRRIVDADKSNFELYENNGKEYICFAEAYMNDWEKEELYVALKKREIVITDCFESLNIIKVKDFINSIKSNLDMIPFKSIDTISITGWLRYIGMNKSHIYYRIKDFKTGVEKIYSVSKFKFRKKIIMEINKK